MKKVSLLSIFLIILMGVWPLFAQESLSPQNIRKFRDQKSSSSPKDTKTIRRMYGDIDFVDLRSFGITSIVSSGIDGEKNSFSAMKGYSADLTWEFPILMQRWGGNTPILKFRIGKSEINIDTDDKVKISEKSSEFIDTLGVSEVYTIGFGAGYCYHSGFNCIYGLYNSYLTGQLSTVKDSGEVSTVPTQLTGATVGMSSTFDLFLGIEFTLGMEYSTFKHATPLFDEQRINTFSIMVALGLVEQSRYSYMDPIEFID